MQTLVNRKKGIWERLSQRPAQLKVVLKAWLVHKKIRVIHPNYFFYNGLKEFLPLGIRSIVMYGCSASGTTIDPSACW